jgi:hypothetical protein
MQKRLHDQYILDKEDMEKKKLKQFEKIDKNNTSKVQENLNKQNQTIQDRLRSRRDKSVSRIRMKKEKLFQSHMDFTNEKSINEKKEEDPKEQLKHFSENLDQINNEDTKEQVDTNTNYEKKDTLADILGKGLPVTSIEIVEKEKSIEKIIEDNETEEKVKEEESKSEEIKDVNEAIEVSINVEQMRSRGNSGEGGLGSEGNFERSEVLLETQDIKVERIMPPEIKKIEEKEPIEAKAEITNVEKLNKVEIQPEIEEPVIENKEENKEEPKEELKEVPIVKIDEKENNEIENEKRESEEVQQVLIKKNSQSIAEGEDIILTNEFSKQNSIEGKQEEEILINGKQEVEEQKVNIAESLPIKEEYQTEGKLLKPEHKKKNLSKKKLRKEKSKKNMRASKKKLPGVETKKKKISHKKNKSEINFKSIQNAKKANGLRKKRKSVAAGNKNYSYIDKLMSQRKIAEKRAKKQSSRKIKNSMVVLQSSKDDKTENKLSKSNVVFPTPPILGNSNKIKKGRSPPKKGKTGKKKVKGKKNAGLDKYLKGPKSVISKFKANK